MGQENAAIDYADKFRPVIDQRLNLRERIDLCLVSGSKPVGEHECAFEQAGFVPDECTVWFGFGY